MKKLISAILVICILLFCLTSCGFYLVKPDYPEGYTGGFGIQPGSGTENVWIETYDEAKAAIELLISHGSTFTKSAFFNYEGDLFDTKYCFKFSGRRGDNPFDRKADKVKIETYGFFDDVSIEEIEYSYVSQYDVLYFTTEPDFDENFLTNNTLTAIDAEKLTCNFSGDVCIYYNEEYCFNLTRVKRNSDSNKREQMEISEEIAEAIISSIVVIGE